MCWLLLFVPLSSYCQLADAIIMHHIGHDCTHMQVNSSLYNPPSIASTARNSTEAKGFMPSDEWRSGCVDLCPVWNLLDRCHFPSTSSSRGAISAHCKPTAGYSLASLHLGCLHVLPVFAGTSTNFLISFTVVSHSGAKSTLDAGSNTPSSSATSPKAPSPHRPSKGVAIQPISPWLAFLSKKLYLLLAHIALA